MNIYKLSNKQEDEMFLTGQPVECDVAMTMAEFRDVSIEVGKPIVIMLSSGKKFKAVVNSFESFQLNDKIKGKIIVKRLELGK